MISTVVSWAALSTRDTGPRFSGSLLLFTEAGRAELSGLSRAEFSEYVTMLRCSEAVGFDFQHRALVSAGGERADDVSRRVAG